VLTLSVALAQDQAPQMPQPLPEVAPADAAAPQPPAAPLPAVVPQPAAPRALPAPGAAANRRPTLTQRRTALPAPGANGSMVPSPSAIAPTDGAAKEPSANGEAKTKTTTPALKFDNAPADIILQAYAQETGKTLLMAPDAPKANITLKSQPDVQLSKEEYIEAIEVVLSMHGIVLEPFGEKFVKVLARKTVRTDGIKILMDSPDGGHPEKSKVVSQMIQLKAITVAEAQKALEGFKKPDGQFQTFERTNSILVTDTQENVNRMLEIVKFIDQPLVATEEVNVRVIRFAKADDIKKRLEELVAESQKQSQAKEEIKANAAGAPGMTRSLTPTIGRPLPPGLSRLGTAPQPAVVTPNEVLETLVSDADRGMIRGKVQIISDERSNQLIIITRIENMNFFDRIISVLDIETTPDVKVDVMRLEFADAEEVSTMLNDLIGNATAKKDSKAPTGSAKGAPPNGAPESPAKSTTLAEAVAARANSRADAAVGDSATSKLGQLSKDNIKILSDKRTNALVMMGSIGDLAAIREIIKGMDIQLSQVLIETVVLEVNLNSKTETGIDWIKRVSGNGEYRDTFGGGAGKSDPVNLFADGISSGSLVSGVAGSKLPGINYFGTLKGLNLDVVIRAAKSDDSAKILSSPVLLTVDNKEATIEATELKYMYKGMRYVGGYGGGINTGSNSNYGSSGYEPDIEQRDVGITVKVTPRISPNGNVMLTVEETFENVLGAQNINGQDWPTITTRKLSADVSVGNGETVILGGLVKTSTSKTEGGIPILKDIPYIGRYLFGSTKDEENRSELLVFLTPYVIEKAEDMEKESRRRREYLNAPDVWTKGWSDSKLADPVPKEEMKKRLERKLALEKSWKEYQTSLEASKGIDAKVDEARMQAENLLKQRTSEVPPSSGLMKVEETVRVLKPEEPEAEGIPPPEAAPVPPVIEATKKSWWKLF
jgi:general secretion pathway protein D